MNGIQKYFFKKISEGEFKGWIREDLIDLLPSNFFRDPVSAIREMKGQVIKESRWRWAVIFALANEKRIFLKRDQTKGWVELLKYLFFPSKARKEWLIAYQISKRNLDVPKPLGWIEKAHLGFVKESYYLSEAIGTGISFIEDLVKVREQESIDTLAKTLRKAHDSGLFHQDLHAGNFLWDGTSFFLSDLHRAKILKSVSLNQRLLNLSQLFHSLRSGWGNEERLRFIEKYFKGEPIPLEKKEELLGKIGERMDRLQRRQWRSRTKRCLKESSEFSIRKEGEVTTFYRKDFSLDRLKSLIEKHLTLIKEKPSFLLKQSPEVLVSMVEEGGDKLYVKHFLLPHLIDRIRANFQYSKGLKAWIASNGLKARGIPSLQALALIEKKDGLGLKESLLVMGGSEKGLEMDRYILRGFGGLREKRLFIKHFAQWLSHLHQRNLYHQDMKTCNILVSENGETWNFHLLDLEDVRMDEKVNEKRLFKNFLQLNTSIPKTISRTDRLRFFKEYTRIYSIVKNEKAFIDRLVEKSRERGVVYVSAEGVIEE